jgi:hypothetical protein
MEWNKIWDCELYLQFGHNQGSKCIYEFMTSSNDNEITLNLNHHQSM